MAAAIPFLVSMHNVFISVDTSPGNHPELGSDILRCHLTTPAHPR
jgi:hypothetical protein